MIMSADSSEVQPLEFVTVKLYVSGVRPVMVTVEPVPVLFPGFIVQFPAGRPVSTTLPVATVHVGWVISPTPGAGGSGLTVIA